MEIASKANVVFATKVVNLEFIIEFFTIGFVGYDDVCECSRVFEVK